MVRKQPPAPKHPLPLDVTVTPGVIIETEQSAKELADALLKERDRTQYIVTPKDQPCHHLSGFLLMGRTSPDGVNAYETCYCKLCMQRRLLAPDWRVIATREVGGEWEYCRT